MNTYEYKVEIFNPETGETIDTYVSTVEAHSNDEAITKIEEGLDDIDYCEDFEITLMDVY